MYEGLLNPFEPDDTIFSEGPSRENTNTKILRRLPLKEIARNKTIGKKRNLLLPRRRE